MIEDVQAVFNRYGGIDEIPDCPDDRLLVQVFAEIVVPTHGQQTWMTAPAAKTNS
jgi:hypothetical protein